ncbi:hypothetical protein GCM10025786_34380 [Nocardioides caeni]
MSALFAWPDGVLDRRRVTRCALARICGACEQPLGRPIVFLGTSREQHRNEFHSPPLHERCAGPVRELLGGDCVEVRTAGFEYVRPGREDADPLPRFVPNSVLA